MAALKFVGEPGMVDTEAMQNRGLNIVDRRRIGNRVIAIVVGLA